MPWNISRSAQFYDKEILKFPTGLEAIKSVVVDANAYVYTADARNVVPAGTILKISATNAKQYESYAGTGRIEGILLHSVDLLAQATNADEPAPMVFHGAVFATTQIVGFTNYASALVSTLNTCKFE